MKKICFVTTISVTLKAFVLETAKYLHEKGGFDITVICDMDNSLGDILPPYIRYIPIKMNRGISFDGFAAILKLVKIFKQEKFDIVQYSTPNAALYSSIAAFLSGVKIRLYAQWGIRYVGLSGIVRKVFKCLEKLVCSLSTNIQPDSFGNLNYSFEQKLYNSSKGEVIWNGSACGVNLNKFNIEKREVWRKEIRDRLDLNEETIVFGFVGRVDKDKGIDEMLEAFKKLSANTNSKLLIVGSDERDERINEELYNWAKQSTSIIFNGQSSEVEKYLAAMDIFLLPSYREGFGSVVAEAEAMGVPVIVTNISGPTDAMLKDKTGLVVEAKNSVQLYEAMKVLFEDVQLRMYFAANSNVFVRENFDSKIFFEKVLENRRKLLNI